MTSAAENGSSPHDGATDAPRPSLSVIVATRDRPQLLRQAVAAILEQRYDGDIEVIAVFDQSDPEEDLAREAPAGESPARSVRVMRNQRRQGLPGARNTGLLASTSDLIAFCDDDDLWLAGKVEAQVAMLEANPEMEVVTTGLFVDAQGRVSTRVLTSPTISFQALLKSRVMEAHPSTYLARRSAVIDGIGLVDEDIPGAYAEDYDWLLRAARRADIGAVMLPLTKVFWHKSSFFADRWQAIADACDYLIAKYPEFESEPVGLARLEGHKALALAALGRGAEARKVARTALGRDRTCRRALVAMLTSTPLLPTDLVMRAVQATGRGL